MSHATEDLEKQLEATVTALEELRDEAQVKLHLANMEARDRWSDFENHLLDMRDTARKVVKKLDEIGDLLSPH